MSRSSVLASLSAWLSIAAVVASLGATVPTAQAAPSQFALTACPFDYSNAAFAADGVAFLRYARELRGESVWANTGIGAGEIPALEAAMNSASCGLNVTGNATMTLADATIIGRKLAGFCGSALTAGVDLGSGSRNTPDAVLRFLQGDCGPGSTAPRFEISTVYFPTYPDSSSGDGAGSRGTDELIGYVYRPKGRGPFPAIVMLHGRSGPYSANVNAACTYVQRNTASPCNVNTLTLRSKMWGEFWAQRGVLAIHVDSFGPRGLAHGFGTGSYDDPARAAVNELTVRPLDAEDAKTYLLTRSDVRADRIALQGWSNGASAALNTMFNQSLGTATVARFRQSLAFYPGCGARALRSNTAYRAGGPTTAFLAGNDEEVDPIVCRDALADAPATLPGGNAGVVEVVTYVGATHDFDDPGAARQSVPANAEAKADAMTRALQRVRAALSP
jgi:dienelactone hydrolase